LENTMDAFNDHLGTPVAAAGSPLHSVPKRHYLRSWTGNTNVSQRRPARRSVLAESPAVKQSGEPSSTPLMIQRLEAGQAVKLRAKKLSVLRIAHGRVWVTLSDIGPYSRVLAGDHFLSRGESITLLPGQELVMEAFGRGEKTSAQFSWGPPGAVAAVARVLPTAHWRGGVMQPLLDLRHAGGLAARAMGRLVLGVGHAFVAEVERVANYVAMIFVAASAGKKRAGSTFDAVARDTSASCRLY
jgi:hypothetical protein